jgi:hypothetical protein
MLAALGEKWGKEEQRSVKVQRQQAASRHLLHNGGAMSVVLSAPFSLAS